MSGLSPRALSGKGQLDGVYGVEVVNELVVGYGPVDPELSDNILLLEDGQTVGDYETLNGVEVAPGTIIVRKGPQTQLGITIQDHDVTVGTNITKLDFQGDGVSTSAGSSGEIIVTVTGGSGGSTYEEYYQEFGFTSASQWVINHNQSTYGLSVFTLDNNGDPIYGAINYPTNNQITVDWGYATTGTARVFS